MKVIFSNWYKIIYDDWKTEDLQYADCMKYGLEKELKEKINKMKKEYGDESDVF